MTDSPEAMQAIKRKWPYKTVYHGTRRENVDSILESGFRVGTYFAFKRNHAAKFGGPYVFSVRLSGDPEMWHGPDDWQFHTTEVVPPSAISRLWYKGMPWYPTT